MGYVGELLVDVHYDPPVKPDTKNAMMSPGNATQARGVRKAL
jgi:hypothetical protein